MVSAQTVLETSVEGLPLIHRGKVRDVYQVNDEQLLLVATDRLSAFDSVLPTPIEHKGRVLTALSAFWFEKLAHIVDNHMITADFEKMPDVIRKNEQLRGRSMLVKKAEVFPVECVVRGYLEGSGWKDYKVNRAICALDLPKGLQHCDKLHKPIFTPSNKAAVGHDDNISQLEFVKIVGHDTAVELKTISKALYNEASEYALTKGIIIADTKFEFGVDRKGNLLLVDEALTPDSSRFWDAASYEPGHAQASFDKQFVREYLESIGWDKQPPAPPLPEEVAQATSRRYIKAYKLLTGRDLDLD